MRLILIRHGIAEDRESFAKEGDAADSLRPLTAEGKRKMKKGAKGLRSIVPKLDLIASSPLKRAMQTAEIVHRAYGKKPKLVELDLLSGDGQEPSKLLPWLRQNDLDADTATVAIVGHEPDLSRWASWFVTGQSRPVLEMKKGAACLLEFPARLAGGKARLEAMLPPGALRKMA